jgi:sugar-specific transcriptional regulator TrmB
MDNTNNLLKQLQALGLSSEESKVYLDLLREPSNHTRISQATGINRTKVYRIVQALEKRSLVSGHTDDRGTFLFASNPEALEIEIVNREDNLKSQRAILEELAPALMNVQKGSHDRFVVRTYFGTTGLKQMCWHEVKADSEVLVFGNGTIEQLISDKRWATKHRARQLAAGYISRELINRDGNEPLPDLTVEALADAKLYQYRTLERSTLAFDSQMVIYNDTVSIYHWKHKQKVGIEIISSSYAEMMRQLFEHFWRLGSRGNS